MTENPLHLLMNPQSIAVVGANNVPTKMGTIQALSILKDGYKGKVFPLHPKEKTVLGCKAYASVEDLPEAPDLAILIVPGKTVIPLIESFGKIGTKRESYTIIAAVIEKKLTKNKNLILKMPLELKLAEFVMRLRA